LLLQAFLHRPLNDTLTEKVVNFVITFHGLVTVPSAAPKSGGFAVYFWVKYFSKLLFASHQNHSTTLSQMDT